MQAKPSANDVNLNVLTVESSNCFIKNFGTNFPPPPWPPLFLLLFGMFRRSGKASDGKAEIFRQRTFLRVIVSREESYICHRYRAKLIAPPAFRYKKPGVAQRDSDSPNTQGREEGASPPLASSPLLRRRLCRRLFHFRDSAVVLYPRGELWPFGTRSFFSALELLQF